MLDMDYMVLHNQLLLLLGFVSHLNKSDKDYMGLHNQLKIHILRHDN